MCDVIFVSYMYFIPLFQRRGRSENKLFSLRTFPNGERLQGHEKSGFEAGIGLHWIGNRVSRCVECQCENKKVQPTRRGPLFTFLVFSFFILCYTHTHTHIHICVCVCVQSTDIKSSDRYLNIHNLFSSVNIYYL